LNGKLPAHQGFQGGEMLNLLQITYSADLKKHVSLEGKPSMLEARASITLFPLITELVFESNAACP
jgi:hypothetical protein